MKDYGADGISTLVGKCQKIWLLYPPTKCNLRAMLTVDGQRAKLSRIMHQLEGGVLLESTAACAIYIPAGCIHATFTLQGGFLIAEDFTTSKSINAVATYITSELDKSLPAHVGETCFSWFERCLDVCLTHRQFSQAIRAWIEAEGRLAEWATSHRQWRVHVRRLWERYVHDGIPDNCPCGMQGTGTTLQTHLFSSHLQFLLSPCQRR